MASFLGKVFQRLKPITVKEKRPIFEAELAITEEAIYKRMKLVPYTPDKLVTRKKIDIFNEMMYDSEVESSINALKTIRMSSGWTIERASDNFKDREIEEFITWNLENIEGSFEDDLREIMGAVELGVSINELVWVPIEKGRWANKVGLKSVKSKNPKYFNIYTDDFDNIREDGIVNISSLDYGKQYPTEKFVIYSFNKRYENVFGTSRIRSLYDLWFLKQIFTRAWGVFMEKYGLPFPVIHHPTIDDETRKNLLEALKQLRTETGLLVPKELDLEIKDAISRGGSIFVDAFKYINDQIRKSILGQTLTTEASRPGSYALGQVHFDILLFYEDQLGKDVEAKAINNQIIKRLVDYNFSNVSDYPKFQFKPLVQQDIEKAIDKYYAGVQAGIIKPIPEDEDVIREYLKFPKRKEEEQPAPAVTQPQFAQQKEYVYFQEKVFTGVKRKGYTQYEEQTDFVDILDMLEGGVAKYVPTISQTVQDAVKDLIEQIDKKRIVPEKNFSGIEKLQLKYVGDVKRTFQDMFEQIYKKGMGDARKEILAKKRIFRGSEFRKFQEIELRHITPKEALDFFKNKAFWMSGIERDNVLKKVKQVLYNTMKTGGTLKDAIEGIQIELEPYYERGLVEEEALRGARLETVVRTNLNEAYNEGRNAFFEAPELDGYVVAYQYSAILDDRVRPNHAAMDGRIYSVHSPVWQMWNPPNGFNCRCIKVPITQDEEWEESPPLPGNLHPDAGFTKVGL